MDTSLCRKKLEHLQQVFCSHPNPGSISFAEIAPDLTEGVLAEVANHPKTWMPLPRLGRRIASSGRFDFWRTVFRARNVLPEPVLMSVWYTSYSDRGDLYWQIVDTPFGEEGFGASLHNPELQAALAFTDPLLIDNRCAAFRYCQLRKTGWEHLRYLFGRRHQTLHLAAPLREAIQADSAPGFCMMLDMTGQKISFSLLAEVMNAGAGGIFRHLLEQDLIPERVIPLPELCCYCTVHFPDAASVPLLSAIEAVHPGLLKSYRDPFGRNLLWYALHNRRTGWFHPACRLTPLLLQCGCDPDNRNQIGLSWRFITENLTYGQKKQQMNHRYGASMFRLSPGLQLRQEQPLADLENDDRKAG